MFGALLGGILPALQGFAGSALGQGLLGAAPAFVGSIATAAGSRRERIAAEDQTARLRKQDREWFETDRAYNEEYAAERLADDRSYASSLLADDRAYTRASFKEDRDYNRRIAIADRRNERNYLAQRLKDDRSYSRKVMLRDSAAYHREQDKFQRNANRLAEKSAASRGIDFKRLVSDAQEAGYNPLTALNMAHAYSTHVDYSEGRTPFARAGYNVSGAGYNAASGGGPGGATAGVPTSAPAGSSHVPAGGFSASGSGYSPNYGPALASGQFVAEAVQRGIDTVFNKPPEKDALAESLKQAISLGEAQQRQAERTPRPMGFALTDVEPFRPAGGVVTAPLAREENRGLRPPQNPLRKQEFIPVRLPNGERGTLDKSIASRLDIKPWDTVSAGDWAEIAGEVAGEAQTTLYSSSVQETATGQPIIKPGLFDWLSTGTRRTQPALSGYGNGALQW